MNRIPEALETTLNDIGREWDIRRQQQTSDWTTKPRFTHSVVSEDGLMELRLETNDNRWGWIDKGTGTFGAGSGRPYTIAPKGNYPLRFRGGYSARTAPIAQSGVGSGQATGDFVTAYSVQHPGIRNRDFTKDYAERNRSAHIAQIENAIRRVINR